jgi:predicted DNA-binding protein
VFGVNTTSVRLPDRLRERVRARAVIERRSFSNTIRVLVEAGLSAREQQAADVDSEEMERLALYHETIGGESR